jgi:hypothetical protein
VGKQRVEAMTIALIILRDGDKQDIPFEIEADNPDALELLKAEIENYEIKPSFRYFATQTLEALSGNPLDGPDGIRHTMDQIQNWFHHRWVHPYAQECKICGQVKAAHGPSRDHKFESKEG